MFWYISRHLGINWELQFRRCERSLFYPSVSATSVQHFIGTIAAQNVNCFVREDEWFQVAHFIWRWSLSSGDLYIIFALALLWIMNSNLYVRHGDTMIIGLLTQSHCKLVCVLFFRIVLSLSFPGDLVWTEAWSLYTRWTDFYLACIQKLKNFVSRKSRRTWVHKFDTKRSLIFKANSVLKLLRSYFLLQPIDFRPQRKPAPTQVKEKNRQMSKRSNSEPFFLIINSKYFRCYLSCDGACFGPKMSNCVVEESHVSSFSESFCIQGCPVYC